MVCIYCAGKTSVTNSRPSKRIPGTWRRRQCSLCNAIFTSRETADLTQTLIVEGNDGSIKPFSRDKLFISLYMSCRHRKAALEDAEALTDTVIARILRTNHTTGTLTKTSVTDVSQKVLQKFDSVAATYYAAYYT